MVEGPGRNGVSLGCQGLWRQRCEVEFSDARFARHVLTDNTRLFSHLGGVFSRMAVARFLIQRFAEQTNAGAFLPSSVKGDSG